METKAYKNNGLVLLPNIYKKVGVGIILFSITTFVIVVLLLPAFRKHVVGFLLMDIVLIGLFIIAASKEKIDDERIMLIRLKAMAFAFFSAVIYALLLPLVNPIFGDLVEDTNGQTVILSMLLMYHLLFWQQTRKQ